MNSGELFTKLWSGSNVLRSKMDANEYKSYLLGLIFYKYLSDRQYAFFMEEEGLDGANEDEIAEVLEDDEVVEYYVDMLGYWIEPEYTFRSMIDRIHRGTFQLEDLKNALNSIEKFDGFKGLFEDVDLYSKKLGTNPQQQTKTISGVMTALSDLNLSEYDGDVLGDAYEYLIGQFASESGKKAGEFYTPSQVSDLMARIAMDGREDKDGLTIFDPTMGSGSLMMTPAKYSNHPHVIRYFGQEINSTTYNLACMNLILHRVPVDNQELKQGDALGDNCPNEEPTNFDLVLMNPPYSAKWSAAKGFLEDPRFASIGVLPPKSRADMAFLLHGLFHLKQDGIMVIVLPHGPLFRGGSEETIRKSLLNSGLVDGIIGLPPNSFVNTPIPTTLWILRKNKDDKSVFFIDASEEFKKDGTKNILTKENVDRIVGVWKDRKDVEKFAHLADFDEIVENDYNLNIPRYVDTFDPEPDVPLVGVAEDILGKQKELDNVGSELKSALESAKGTSEGADKDLKTFMKLMFPNKKSKNESEGEAK